MCSKKKEQKYTFLSFIVKSRWKLLLLTVNPLNCKPFLVENDTLKMNLIATLRTFKVHLNTRENAHLKFNTQVTVSELKKYILKKKPTHFVM